jgi:hypothetical protein
MRIGAHWPIDLHLDLPRLEMQLSFGFTASARPPVLTAGQREPSEE